MHTKKSTFECDLTRATVIVPWRGPLIIEVSTFQKVLVKESIPGIVIVTVVIILRDHPLFSAFSQAFRVYSFYIPLSLLRSIL